MVSSPGVAGDDGAALEKAATEGDGGEERRNRGEREKEKRKQNGLGLSPPNRTNT